MTKFAGILSIYRSPLSYGFIPTDLPSGTFDGQDKDIPTGGSTTMIIAPKTMSDEIAYAIRNCK
jgi:TRAP-type uncharacterized transport system substrate-binding protein